MKSPWGHPRNFKLISKFSYMRSVFPDYLSVYYDYDTDKHSCKNELTVSSKAESVELTFSSLASQNNSFFFSLTRHLTLFNARYMLYIPKFWAFVERRMTIVLLSINYSSGTDRDMKEPRPNVSSDVKCSCKDWGKGHGSIKKSSFAFKRNAIKRSELHVIFY